VTFPGVPTGAGVRFVEAVVALGGERRGMGVVGLTLEASVLDRSGYPGKGQPHEQPATPDQARRFDDPSRIPSGRVAASGDPCGWNMELRHFVNVTRIAERGLFDMAFLADG